MSDETRVRMMMDARHAFREVVKGKGLGLVEAE